MFHAKPLSRLLEETSESGSHTLRRSLGALNLVAIGVGVIIGAGLFSLNRHRPRQIYSGPAVNTTLNTG